MNKRLKLHFFYIFLIAIFISFPAMAIVLGGSNFGITGYPDHNCVKPYKPYEFTTRNEVALYKADLRVYTTCIKKYVENAENDIKRIKESAQNAIDEANSL